MGVARSRDFGVRRPYRSSEASVSLGHPLRNRIPAMPAPETCVRDIEARIDAHTRRTPGVWEADRAVRGCGTASRPHRRRL